MNRKLTSILAFVLIAVLVLPITVQAKSKAYVKKLKLDYTEVTMMTEDDSEVEATVKVKGNADYSVTAVSSDEEIVSVLVEPEDEEPGLSYIVIMSGTKTGEATITVTTVGVNKKNKTISKKVKVTVEETK